jgi:hypothetical protein
MVNANNVFTEINTIVETCQCSVVDAIVEYSTRSGIELEIIGALVKSNKQMNEKLYNDSKSLNLVD